MPSPTERTVPTSETSASVPKLAIWSRMTLEISAARMSIFSLSSKPFRASALHCVSEIVQFGADRAVDHLRADLDDEPPENGRVDGEIHRDVAADAGLEIGLERSNLTVVERVRRGDFCGGLAAMARCEKIEEA